MLISKTTKEFQVIGPVIKDYNVYIERPADNLLLNHLLRHRHCNLHSGRQAGKTSLMQVCKIVLSGANSICIDDALYLYTTVEKTLNASLKAMVESIRNQLKSDYNLNVTELPSNIDTKDIFPWLLCTLDNLPDNHQVYLMIDEFDSILLFPPNEVCEALMGLRSYIQKHTVNIRATLLLVSVRTLVEILHNSRTGGIVLNILDIPLRFFDANDAFIRKQIAAQGFPEVPLAEIDPLLRKVLDFTGGQPFLTSLILDGIQRADDRLQQFREYECNLSSGCLSIVEGHIKGIRKQVLDNSEDTYTLMSTYERILKGEKITAYEGGLSATALENIGIVRLVDGQYMVANPIYKMYLTKDWIDQVLDIQQREERKYYEGEKDKYQQSKPKSTKKIALLFTGGTAGMVTPEGTESTFQGASKQLYAISRERLAGIADVKPIQILDPPRDGINMTPKEWTYLAGWIHDHLKEYNGFVISGGTDTLCYTASALAFILGNNLNVPIIFTGAQTTIDILHGDALDNFIRSCYVAAHDQAINEVQVVFGDKVLRAVRAEKTDDRLYEGFGSPGWPELARITEHFLINEYALGGRPFQDGQIDTYKPFIGEDILPISLVPGLLPNRFSWLIEESNRNGNPFDGVIIHTPGLGNIPSVDRYNFRDIIRQTVESGIPVLVTSQVPINPYTQPQYETARVVEDYGAILAGNITFSAALAKFAWVIGCVRQEYSESNNKIKLEEIKTRIRKNYVGEQK